MYRYWGCTDTRWWMFLYTTCITLCTYIPCSHEMNSSLLNCFYCLICKDLERKNILKCERRHSITYILIKPESCATPQHWPYLTMIFTVAHEAQRCWDTSTVFYFTASALMLKLGHILKGWCFFWKFQWWIMISITVSNVPRIYRIRYSLKSKFWCTVCLIWSIFKNLADFLWRWKRGKKLGPTMSTLRSKPVWALAQVIQIKALYFFSTQH